MNRVICTTSRDAADDVEDSVEEFEDFNAARAAFDQRIKRLMYEALDNEFLNCTLSMHNHKALMRMEGTHYCVVLQKG